MKPDDEEPAGPDPEAINLEAILSRARAKTEQQLRIGLRQGENEIVLKIIVAGAATGRPNPGNVRMGGLGGGGAAFTFNFRPEGDDVLTHEVATALRHEAQDPAWNTFLSLFGDKEASPAPSSKPPAAKATAPAKTDSTKIAVTPSEPKKVSLVGEKSAPLKTDLDEDSLSPAERRRHVLREFFRARIDPVGRIIAEELAKLKEEERLVKRLMPETMVMEELDKPRQAYVFVRGLYKNHGENVSPATPAVLPPLGKDMTRDRLGLAKWLVSPQHPLTARVLVNRIWQQYFRTRNR